MASKISVKSTLNASEIAKFEAMAEEWWDPRGKFKPLHQFNPTRIAYIRDAVVAHFNLDSSAKTPLKNMRLLDVGCGGGLLSEPFARLGAHVTGIDGSEKNIAIAKLHAEKEKLSIDYQSKTAEALAAKGKKYDVVLAMEIIEHVDNVPVFIQACSDLVKPGGLLFIATLNRTAKSYIFAILGAEYVLRWLPKGTHDWRKFLTPGEIGALLAKQDMRMDDLRGMQFNPITQAWRESSDTSVNYVIRAIKGQ